MQNWLFSSGNHAWAHDFDERERADFQRGPVPAYLEETPVFPGIWLYRGEAAGRSRFNMEVEAGAGTRGRIIMGSMLGGNGVMALEGCDEQTWREDGRTYLLSPTERRMRYDIAAEDGWRTIALRLETEALDLLGSDGNLPDVVRDVLEGRVDDLANVATISGPLRAVSHMLLRMPYEGSMRVLYRQAKVLELLAHLFDRFEVEDERGPLASREMARVRRARERLLEDLREPPDLETLALDVGLTPKRLNRGFRSLYGTTVFNYLRDARLDAARAALEGGTPLSLKQLAWELGYGQVTNFATAFRRRFGVAPGAYRAQAAE